MTDRHFGRLLRAYRHVHVPTLRQNELADRLDISQGHLSNLERSVHPVTDLANLERWSRVIKVPPDLLWFTLSPQCSDQYATPPKPPTVTHVDAITGDDVRRRQFLRTASASATTVGLTLLQGGTTAGRNAVTMAQVHDIRRMTTEFRQTDNRLGGGAARTGLDNYLTRTVAPMLKDDAATGSVKQALFRAVIELRQLAGWVAYDVGHVESGRGHLREALSMSQDIDDDALAGEMFAAMSHHAAFRRGGDTAVDLALAAHQAARHTGLAALEAEAAVMEAHGRAIEQDRHACLAALRRAERAFARIDTDKTPPWLSYFDASYMAAKFAHAFRDLGMSSEAEQFARRSLVMTDGYTRGKLFNTALLASTLADQRRVDEACAEAFKAAAMAADLRSVRATNYLSDVARRLAPFPTAEVRRLYRELDRIGVAIPRT